MPTEQYATPPANRAEQRDRERQAAVDQRGYYNRADEKRAKRDPKMRANFKRVKKR